MINTLAIASLRIPDKLKLNLLNLSVFLMVFITGWRWLNNDIKSATHSELVNVFSVILFILILVFCIERRISTNTIHWKPLFWFGWYLCFIFIFLTSFIHDVNPEYFLWSILSIVYFPLLYIVLQDKADYRFIFRTIAWSMIICSYLFIIFSLVGSLVFFNDTLSMYYLGIVNNPNGNGTVSIGFFAAAMYLLFDDKKINGWAILTAAISISLSIESLCRTAELAFALMALAAWLFYMKNNWQENKLRY